MSHAKSTRSLRNSTCKTTAGVAFPHIHRKPRQDRTPRAETPSSCPQTRKCSACARRKDQEKHERGLRDEARRCAVANVPLRVMAVLRSKASPFSTTGLVCTPEHSSRGGCTLSSTVCSFCSGLAEDDQECRIGTLGQDRRSFEKHWGDHYNRGGKHPRKKSTCQCRDDAPGGYSSAVQLCLC